MLRQNNSKWIAVCIACGVVFTGVLIGGAARGAYAVCADNCAVHECYNVTDGAGVITGHWKSQAAACWSYNTNGTSTKIFCRTPATDHTVWFLTNTFSCSSPGRYGQDP